jgi:hypothetical protein
MGREGENHSMQATRGQIRHLRKMLNPPQAE